MSWSEAGLKERLASRAKELGKSLRTIYAEAGLGHDTLDKIRATRRLDTIEKLATAVEWSLCEMMGCEVLTISRPLSQRAWQHAKRAVARLPRDAQTEARQVDFHAWIYDWLAARERDRLPTGNASVRLFVNGLVRVSQEENAALGKSRPHPPTH